MVEILFLLLPIAFYSGWRAARRHFFKQQEEQCQLSDSFVKGVNFLLSEQPDKALEVFLNYPDIDAYTAETYQLLGNMFRGRGEVDRALRVHQNLIARSNLSPKQKEKAMFSLGEDFFAAGMLDRAERVFQELLDNAPNNKTISKALVCGSLRSIYEQTREWEKAIEATRCIMQHGAKGKLIAVLPGNENHSNDDSQSKSHNNKLIAHYFCELADEALVQGNLHEVEDLMNKAQGAYKQSTRLMSLRGDVALHQKQHKKAIKYYLEAINQDSRLLSMLFQKLETSAKATNQMTYLLDELIKQYKIKKDKSVLEIIIDIADQYQTTIFVDELIKTELSDEKLSVESIYKATEYIHNNNGNINPEKGLLLVNKSLENYLKGLPKFSCEHCGYRLHDYLWRCPACQQWDTIHHA